MYDITAFGELLIDFTPSGTNEQGIPLFSQNPGGAPANVLAMINKLGGKTAFIGKVGDDEFGRFLEMTLVNAGIDTAGLLKDTSYRTTLAFVHLSQTGDRSFTFYRREGADMMLFCDEINHQLIREANIFHFGSVSLSGQPCRNTLYQAVSYAAEKGKVISYDPNYRALLWPNKMIAKREIEKPISAADILKVSEEEMTLLTDETDLEKGAARLMEEGPAIVLVSLGAKGAYFRCAAGSGSCPAYDVKTVDTTGAGDSFLGAVLYRLRNKSHAELKAIARAELADIIDFANAAGSLSTTKKGAIPALPNAAEIEACRRETKSLS